VSDALVYDKTIVKGVTGATDWDSLVDLIDGKSGWMLNLKNHSWDPVDHTGERNLGQAALLGGALLFTTYIPSDNVCTFEGSSLLYAEYYTTGTPYFKPIIGKNLLAPTVDEKNANLSFLSLGIGLATTPNVHVQEDGSRAFVQDSSGKIHVIDIVNPLPTKSGVRSWLLNED
jgi:type IV pilus assembly protein PilY1